MDDLLH